MSDIPVEAVNAAASQLWTYERAAVAGIRQEETRYVAERILAAAAPILVAAAEARGRKQGVVLALGLIKSAIDDLAEPSPLYVGLAEARDLLARIADEGDFAAEQDTA